MENIEANEKPKKKSVTAFLKSHKPLIFALIAVLAVVVIGIVIITAIHADRAEKIEQAQIGKCYINKYDGGYNYYTEILYFQENGYSKLYMSYADPARQTIEYLSGSLNEIYGDYSIKISLFGQHYLDFNEIEVNDEMTITGYGAAGWSHEWAQISLEEALAIEEESNAKYALAKCEHKFGDAQVIKKATCSDNGEEKQVCTICGYEQIEKTKKLEHNYVNKVCSVCGEKQPVEKSDIKANTWYTDRDNVLRFQNIKLVDVTPLNNGRGALVSYYFVCQHCHVVDDSLKSSVPEYNYAISKLFTCDECGKSTTVKIEMK